MYYLRWAVRAVSVFALGFGMSGLAYSIYYGLPFGVISLSAILVAAAGLAVSET
jgi:hypothetical protein